MVTPLVEEEVWLLICDSSSIKTLSIKKPGSFGWVNSLSLLSITTTDAMFGRSLG